VEAAEQPNNLVQPLFNLRVIQRFQSLFEFVICVEGDEVWGLGTLIHEVLECLVSCLLELHIVLEG
jgi:hypothetical protein